MIGDLLKPNRIKILTLDAPLLVGMFMVGRRIEVLESRIPKDARIVWVVYDETRMSVNIYLEHESFEIIDPRVEPFPEMETVRVRTETTPAIKDTIFLN